MVQFGAGTGSDYGTGVLDTEAVLSTGDIISLALLDDFQSAIVAIETLLGAAPEGSQASVQARLAAGNFPALLIDASDAKIIVKDTDGVWGTAIPRIEFQDSAGTVGGIIGWDTGQDITLANSIAGKFIDFVTDGGLVISRQDLWVTNEFSAGSAAELVVRDILATGTAALMHMEFRDDANTVQGRMGFLSASDGHFTIQNAMSGGDIEFQTSSGDFVLVTLPSSDPVKAGALWNNSGVVNVSAG